MVWKLWVDRLSVVALCLALISNPGLGAPVPRPRVRQDPGEIVVNKTYYATWAHKSLPGKMVFYDCGTFEYVWIRYMYSGELQVQRILGKWDWDSTTRVLKLVETHIDFVENQYPHPFTFVMRKNCLTSKEGVLTIMEPKNEKD